MNTPTDIQGIRDPRFAAGADLDHSWQLAAAAAMSWFGVGILGAWDAIRDGSGEGSPYVLFSIALMLSAALTIAALWSSTAPTERETLRRLGLGVGILAALSAVVAWAGPLWMTLIATSVAVLAVAAPPDMRPGLTALAVGQTLGIVVTVGAISAEVGRQDSYGDYPAAHGLGVAAAAAGSALGLALLARAARNSGE